MILLKLQNQYSVLGFENMKILRTKKSLLKRQLFNLHFLIISSHL
jgi:hypothetical protein